MISWVEWCPAAWQAHGRRETRTLLYELGYEATDDLLDILHRPVYLAGYLNGYEKTVKYKSRLEAAEAAAEQGKEYRKQLQELQKVEHGKTAEILEVKQLLQEEKANSIYWRKLYQQEAKENQQLREINNELVQSLPEPEEIVKHTEQIEQQENQSVEEKVMAALETGMSYAEAGKLAGVSKSTAYRIKQQAEQDNNIITIGKAAGES